MARQWHFTDLNTILQQAINTCNVDLIESIHVDAKILWSEIPNIYHVRDIKLIDVLLPKILRDDPLSRIPVCWLIRAAKHGNQELLEYMLHVDQAFLRGEHHLALCQAATHNQTKALAMLLVDERFDPAWAQNDALACAAMQGHMTCVIMLLTHPRTKAYDCDNRALAYAAHGGHHAVVDELMRYDGVDPYAMQSRAMQWAAQRGHFGVLRRLLSAQ